MASKLDEYSVRTKVMAAFACVLLATIGLAAFSAVRLSQVQTNIVEFSDDWVPGIRAVGDLKFIAMRLRQREAVYLMLASDAERSSEQANLDKIKSEFEDAYKRLAVGADSDVDKSMLQQVRQTWDAYLAHEPSMFALLGKGQQAAVADYSGEAKRLHDALKNTLTEDATYHAQGGEQSGTAAKGSVTSGYIWLLVGLGLAMALCIAAGNVLIRSVSTPLNDMTDAMGRLAAGQLDTHVPHADKHDEIGRLAEAMTGFKNQLAQAERSKQEQVQLIVGSIGSGLDFLANGDLTHRIATELTGPFAKLKEDFNAAMVRLQDTLKNVLTSSGQITSGAGEISQAAEDLSRRTEQQAASLEETAAALEEITATVKRTAANAKEARANVTTAKAAAEEGGKVVDTAITAMDGIAQSSKQITDIIGVIDEIAFQTNLLALNAGVEAARAGDAGRGFAVVATEVRALAGRSSEAAKKIKSLIQTSSQQVESGVRLVGESGTSLRNIVEQVQKINALVTEMAQAAEQQSVGIEQVNAAVGQMDQVTQQNAAMVEESTAASRSLAQETSVLQGLIGFFNVGHSVVAPRQQPRTVPRSTPKAVAARAGAPARRTATAAATAPDGDWTEF